MKDFFSFVLPCYNEAPTLPALVDRLVELFMDQSDCEVILVDNGSTDNTASILPELLRRHEVLRSVRIPVNQGYGYGILQGLKEAKGDFLGWAHGDLQNDPADMLRGKELITRASESRRTVVKGRRHGRSWLEIIFTVGMAGVESVLFGAPFWDITGQPTIFSRTFYETWRNPPHDFFLDLFAFANAREQGLKILRFDVALFERNEGNSSWNTGMRSKLKQTKNTISYSFKLKKEMAQHRLATVQPR